MSPTVYTTSQPLLHKRSVGTAEIPACPSAPSSSLYHSSPLCRQVTKPTRNCLFSSSTEYKPPSSSAGQAKLSSAQPPGTSGFLQPCVLCSGAMGNSCSTAFREPPLWRADGDRSALPCGEGAICTHSSRSNANSQLLMLRAECHGGVTSTTTDPCSPSLEHPTESSALLGWCCTEMRGWRCSVQQPKLIWEGYKGVIGKPLKWAVGADTGHCFVGLAHAGENWPPPFQTLWLTLCV